MPFNPNGDSLPMTFGEVNLELTWKTTTGGSEIQGKLGFRGKEVQGFVTLDRPCRGSDIRSLLDDLVSMGYREFVLDVHTTDVLLQPAIREIRDKLADDYGIT
jgi:hypothetical protein